MLRTISVAILLCSTPTRRGTCARTTRRGESVDFHAVAHATHGLDAPRRILRPAELALQAGDEVVHSARVHHDFGVPGGPLNGMEARDGYITTPYHTCEAVPE